jgi:hypothetical protein
VYLILRNDEDKTFIVRFLGEKKKNPGVFELKYCCNTGYNV